MHHFNECVVISTEIDGDAVGVYYEKYNASPIKPTTKLTGMQVYIAREGLSAVANANSALLS